MKKITIASEEFALFQGPNGDYTVYCAMKFLSVNHKTVITIKLSAISDLCGISETSVCQIMKRLVAKQVVRAYPDYGGGGGIGRRPYGYQLTSPDA